MLLYPHCQLCNDGQRTSRGKGASEIPYYSLIDGGLISTTAHGGALP